jgi:hypothetical protein
MREWASLEGRAPQQCDEDAQYRMLRKIKELIEFYTNHPEMELEEVENFLCEENVYEPTLRSNVKKD